MIEDSGQSALRRGRLGTAKQAYSLTTALVGREPLLRVPENALVIVSSLQWLRKAERIVLHGYSVMPDHIHVVLTVLEPHELPGVVHSIKSYTANQINRASGRTGGLWQHGYYDHALRNDLAVVRHLRYVLENPVRPGLAERVGEHQFTRVFEGAAEDLDPW